MNNTIKLWTQLGLGTALAGGLLAACGGEAGGEGAEAGAVGGATAAVAADTAGDGASSGGAGGEGEGGVAVSDAATDPVAYGIALAVTEAHVVAARDAYMAGKKDAAAEMFAHPVSEVLVDMDPVFATLGVADFKDLLTAASIAASEGQSTADVTKDYDAIIAALRGAATKAPTSAGASVGASADASASNVATAIISDMIERSSAMYRTLPTNDSYEPYLDGYGFAKVAAGAFAASGAGIKAANPALYARIADALDLLAQAYPGAGRPAKLPVEPGAVSGASAKVMLAAGS